MPEPQVRATLPVHPIDPSRVWPGRLRVDGLVGRELELTPDDLAALPRDALTDDFTCLEGWTAQDLRWGGVLLRTVLELAAVPPAARWIQASAGDFSAPIPLDAVGQAIIATHLDGQPLSAESGGPARLVVPGSECFTSVKWLDHLELRAEPGPNTAQTIALGRLG
jgi:DMSO/TMAO reductase YedYZ molybdopterin-dependent catalytic subunit